MQDAEDLRYEIFDRLIDRNVRFALYQLPQTTSVHLILQTSGEPHVFDNISGLNEQKGFVISPFSVSQAHPVIVIQGDKILEGEDAIFNFLETYPFEKTYSAASSKRMDEGLANFEKYSSIFEAFHSNVADDNLQKLVLSRTADVERKSSTGLAFKRACQKYKDNFVYLCYTPESGAWLGSSPEIILSGNKGNWKTDALAGTQKVNNVSDEITWDEKNIYEQGIVMKYMQNQLNKIGVTSVNDTPITIYSGDLAHLKSEFRFQLPDNNRVGDVLNILHPTPAVCGFPKDKAFKFILENEKYDRAYYTGFIGVLDADNQTNLYVNLRCMQILPHSLRLYAGGGIMPDSEAQLEWQETDYKLQTILSIL